MLPFVQKPLQLKHTYVQENKAECTTQLTSLLRGTRTITWMPCGFCRRTSATLVRCMWHPYCMGLTSASGLGLCAPVAVHLGAHDQCA